MQLRPEQEGESPLILLIDGDIVAHRVAAAGQKQRYTLASDPMKIFDSHKEAVAYVKGYMPDALPPKEEVQKAHIEVDDIENVLSTFDIMIEKIQDACFAKYGENRPLRLYLVFTGCDEEQNFREAMYPEYKANRHGVAKPAHLPAVIEYAKKHKRCLITQGYEADDMLGRAGHDALKKFGSDATVVFVSYDKDVKQLPGNHYNFVKEEHSVVSEIEGYRLFFKQMLIGDTADNVTGVKGIGEKTAAKLLDSVSDPEEMMEVVKREYFSAGIPPATYNKNCDLLWIWRTVPDACPFVIETDHV